MTVRSRYGLAFIIALGLVLCDQALKMLIVDHFQPEPKVLTVMPFFDLILTWNRGISFGLLHNVVGRWVLIGVGTIIIMVLIDWVRKASNRLQIVSLGLIIGGAIGNIIDRLRFGAVIDYLLFHLKDYYFPAFNLADAAISIGVAVYLYGNFIDHSSSSSRFLTKKR